jgi:DNA-binding MarR family transcriptional regulator
MIISSQKDKKRRGRKPGVRFPREGLSDNEATVLRGLCLHPWAVDRELSGAIGIKMSTLTAIKNRLKRMGAYRKAYIPAYHRLGYTLLSVSMTRMAIGNADVQGGGLPGTVAVFSVRDTLGCFVLALHKGYEDHQVFVDKLDGIAGSRDGSEGLRGPWGHSWHHDIFVLRNGRRLVEFDFTNAVNKVFYPDEVDGHSAARLDDESYVMRRKVVPGVLRALIAMPEANALALVKPTGYTRQSITKTTDMLRCEGIINRATLVDLNTMGMELVAVTMLRIADDGTKKKSQPAPEKAISNIERAIRPFWYFVFGEHHVLLSCHANYDQYMATMAEVQKIGGVTGLRTRVFGTRSGDVRYGFGMG